MRAKRSTVAAFWALLLCIAFTAPAENGTLPAGSVIISNTLVPAIDGQHTGAAPFSDGSDISLIFGFSDPVEPITKVKPSFSYGYFSNVSQWEETGISAKVSSSSAQYPALGTITLYEAGVPVMTLPVDGNNSVMLTWVPSIAGARGMQMKYTPSDLPLEPFTEAATSIFTINVQPAPKGVDLCEMELSTPGETFVYTGQEHRPAVSLWDATGPVSVPLIEGVDYALSYEDNTAAGQGKVIATGMGGYGKTKEILFPIDRAETRLTLTAQDTGQARVYEAFVERFDPVDGTWYPVDSGNVSFEVGAGAVLTPVAQGKAVVNRPEGVGGATAQYMGDANHLASPVEMMEDNIGTKDAFVAVSVDDRTETDATLIATVQAAEAGMTAMPNGVVSFFADGLLLGNAQISGGSAAHVWNNVPEGAHAVVAQYEGDSVYAAAQSEPLSLMNVAYSVQLEATRTGATSAKLTATLDGNGASPTGMISFFQNGARIDTVPVVGSSASISVDNLLPGVYAFTASYSGDANYFPKSGSYSVGLDTEEAMLLFSVEQNPDGSVDLIATIVGGVPGAVPGGTVLFQGDGLPDGASAEIGPDGRAVYHWEGVPTGEISVTAAYAGDSNYPGLTSPVEEIRNLPVASQLSMVPTATGGFVMSLYVQPYAATAPMPTGTVTFTQDGLTVKETALSNNVASHTYEPTGKQMIASAIYSGDINYFPREETVVVGEDFFTTREGEKLRPSVTVAATAGSGEGPATLTATVTGTGGQFPTGQVIFSKDKEFLGVQELYRGEAVFSWTEAPQGSHTIYAEYRGDDKYQGDTAVTVFRKNGHISPLTPEMMRKNPQFVILRDRSGKNLMVYDTTLLPMYRGVMTLDAKRSENFYSYGFNLGHLRDLSRRQKTGYFDIKTPAFTMQIPYGLSTQMRDLVDYIIDRDLRPSELELRIEITTVGKNDSIATLYREQISDMENTRLMQVNLRLYTLENKQLDFFATKLDSPLVVELPEGGTTQIAHYDRASKQFVPVELVDTEKKTVMTVQECGVYRLAKIP